MKGKSEITKCSDYEAKMQYKLEKEGIIMHPDSQDLEDKNNYIFLQVFSSLTDCYIEEEINKLSDSQSAPQV